MKRHRSPIQGRSLQYRSKEEHLLTIMINNADEKGEVPRYLVRSRGGAWIKAAEMDEILERLGIPTHYREDSWRGRYYLAHEIAPILFKLREQLDKEDREVVERIFPSRAIGDRGW